MQTNGAPGPMNPYPSPQLPPEPIPTEPIPTEQVPAQQVPAQQAPPGQVLANPAPPRQPANVAQRNRPHFPLEGRQYTKGGYAQAPADQQGYPPASAVMQSAEAQQAQASHIQARQIQARQIQARQIQAQQLQAQQLQAQQAEAQQFQEQQFQEQQLQEQLPARERQSQQMQANSAQTVQQRQSQRSSELPPAPLAHRPSTPPDFGPTHPSQYLRRNSTQALPSSHAPPTVADNYGTHRYVQSHSQLPPGQQPQSQQFYEQQLAAQPSYSQQPYGQQRPTQVGTGTTGWTGNQPGLKPQLMRQGQLQRAQSSRLQSSRLAPSRAIAARRRYRYEDDFVPTFGTPQAESDSWLLSLPVINWHNLPLGNMRFWTALGGIAFAAIMLNVLGTSPVISSIVKSRNRQCQEVIQPNSVLSRQQLTQLLAVPERSPKSNIQEIVRQPYCTLPSLNIRAGVNAMREAYPLEFDPDTWIVVLYEGDEYAGYRFNTH